VAHETARKLQRVRGEEIAMACPIRSTCTVLTDMCSALELKGWEQAYCDRDSASCERRKLSEAGAAVPDDLLPDGRILVTMGELEEC
jgi:hypothetical protein